MKRFLSIITGVLLSCTLLFSQTYQFTPVKEIKVTPVKNQARTGTCWCFATVSFLEAELIRMGKGEYNLSEMFIVRNNYIERLQDDYLRSGEGNLYPGSIAHMATKVVAKYGLMPEEAYNGINYASPTHNHTELSNYLVAIAGEAVKMKRRSPEYFKLINSVLDIYLGEVPEKFNYKGKEYDAKSFAISTGLNMDDYIEFTSFSHHPFYQLTPLEIPDNWDHEKLYNVPLDDFMAIVNYSLENGYTIVWDGDISEKCFMHNKGIAINPDVENLDRMSKEDREKFEKMNINDRLSEVAKLEKKYPEVVIDQKKRQDDFETFLTVDDHLMHLTGIVKDQDGTRFYVTKNSWGTERNKGFGDGYLNMSESFVRAKTISMMVHKNAVPKEIKKKLGLK